MNPDRTRCPGTRYWRPGGLLLPLWTALLAACAGAPVAPPVVPAGSELEGGGRCTLAPVHPLDDRDAGPWSAEDRSILEADAACILRTGRPVVIEGHSDPRGTAEYNLARADRMARAVKSLLVELGVAPSLLSTRSYGEDRPVCIEHSEACWRQCRRVELRFE